MSGVTNYTRSDLYRELTDGRSGSFQLDIERGPIKLDLDSDVNDILRDGSTKWNLALGLGGGTLFLLLMAAILNPSQMGGAIAGTVVVGAPLLAMWATKNRNFSRKKLTEKEMKFYLEAISRVMQQRTSNARSPDYLNACTMRTKIEQLRAG